MKRHKKSYQNIKSISLLQANERLYVVVRTRTEHIYTAYASLDRYRALLDRWAALPRSKWRTQPHSICPGVSLVRTRR